MWDRGTKTLVTVMVFFLLGWGTAWGAETKKATTPTEVPEEMKEKPPARPEEPTGYFPGVLPPSPYGTLELGPTGGLLSPYGNPTAYDSLLRGWRTHRVGKVILTPYLGVDGLYRSNIYLTPSHKLSDFIFVVTPGVRAELPIAGRHRLSVGYLGSGFFYTTYSENSHYDQNINVDLALNFRGGTTVRVGNTLRLATEERNSTFAFRRTYWRDTPYVTVTRAFADRWKLELNYQFDTLLFAESSSDVNNYGQHSTGATLYYRFWPKTAILAQYIFTYRDYSSASGDNNYSHSPLVGLTWDPTAKLSGVVKFGYTFKEYETSLVGRNNSPDNWILSAQLLYRFSRYTTMTLTAQRSFQEDLDFGNSGYRNTGVWVTLNHEWHYFKVFSYASFFYLNNDYLSPAFDLGSGTFKRRLDEVVGAGVGLNRAITRYLKVRVDYIYTNRASNFFGYGYNDHKVLVGLQASF